MSAKKNIGLYELVNPAVKVFFTREPSSDDNIPLEDAKPTTEKRERC